MMPIAVSAISPFVVMDRLLWRCLFAVFAVVVGTVVLTAVPQAREALMVSAADAGERRLHAASFVCAVLYGAGAAWFTTRLLLLDSEPAVYSRSQVRDPAGLALCFQTH